MTTELNRTLLKKSSHSHSLIKFTEIRDLFEKQI